MNSIASKNGGGPASPDRLCRDKLEWIPWQRYLLLLEIDGKKTVNLGRFRRKEGVCHTAQRLNTLKGYDAKVVDTKEQKDG